VAALLSALAGCSACSESSHSRTDIDAGPHGSDAASSGSGGAPSMHSSGGAAGHATDAATTQPGDAASDLDPEPTLSDHERELLLSLSPDVLPKPPADPTNRFADDPVAAALGERFFFDPSFSGKLLSTDHDGTPGSL